MRSLMACFEVYVNINLVFNLKYIKFYIYLKKINIIKIYSIFYH